MVIDFEQQHKGLLMALCHDERDFAMGFTRRDPHAHRYSRSSTDREKEQARKLYLKSLTPHQKKAYDRIHICLRAIGQYLKATGDMVNITTRELHEHFPVFAKNMGWNGPLYRKIEESCRAVDISFPKTEGSFWFLNPYLDYDRSDDAEQKQVHTKKARRAARIFLEAWMPKWNWDEIKLKS